MKFNTAFASLAILVFASIVVAGCTGAYQQQPQQAPAPLQPTGVVKTVIIDAEGFSPATIEINAGDAVMFANRDTVPHRPASAQHPTHALYPEAGGCTGSKFDACKDLAQGESFTFNFYQKGEWTYHDHLNCCTDSRFFGKVIVR